MPTIALAGPLIIGKDASIRSCAFFRGNVIIGEGAVAGNSCEFKNAILFNKAQVPHFSYVGDSIMVIRRISALPQLHQILRVISPMLYFI